MPDLQLGSMLHPALSPSFLEKAISKGNARGRSGLGSYRLQETSCSSTVLVACSSRMYICPRYQNTHEVRLVCLSIKLTVLNLQAQVCQQFHEVYCSHHAELAEAHHEASLQCV